MTVAELFSTLALAIVAGWGWWLYHLENILKGYRGDGRISLIRKRLPWPVHFCVSLPGAVPKSAEPIRYRLHGLPPGRIYTLALIVPSKEEIASWHIKPFRVRLENQGHSLVAADSSSYPLAGFFNQGVNRYHFPAHASFRVSENDRWELLVTLPKLPAGAACPYLLVTSQAL